MMKKQDGNKDATDKNKRTVQQVRGKPGRRHRRKKRGSAKNSIDSTLILERPGRQRPIPFKKSEYVEEPIVPKDAFQPVCVICQKQILEPVSLLELSDSEEFAHIECILANLEQNEKLEPQQRLAYIGCGNIAVVENQKVSNRKTVTKVIRYAKKTSHGNMLLQPNWRKKVAITPRLLVQIDKTNLLTKSGFDELDN